MLCCADGRSGPVTGRVVRSASAPAVRVRQGPSLTVLAVVGLGLVDAGRGHWRAGVGTVALGLLLAAGLRLLLPARRAGWLVVRSRAFDAVLLLLAGAAVLALALTIPHPG